MQYYQVVPLTRISLKNSPFFTYSHPEKIPFGSLVEVDFGKKKLRGFVVNSSKKPIFKTRQVRKIISPSLLTRKQLRLAKKISKHYFTSLGVVLKFFVLAKTKKETSQEFKTEADIEKITPTKDQKKAIEKILKEKKQKNFLLFGPASSGKTEVIMRLAKKIIKEKKQALILVPEIFLGHQEIERYHKRFPKIKIAFLHSQLKPSEITFINNQTKKGELDLVISTRMGLFLPFKNLGLIAVDEEQDISYKQWDQMPHYHAREVTLMFAGLHKKSNTKTIFASGTPSISSCQKIANKKLIEIELPPLKTKKFKIAPPNFQIVDLKKYYKKNEILISKELEKALEFALKKNKISIVFVPNRGKSRSVMCEDCKTILRCPNCETPIVHLGEKFHCLHCNFKTSTFSSCPKCKSFRIIDLGFGTEGVKSKLQTIFPKAKIEMVDGTVFEKNKKRKKVLDKLKNNKVDIVVGTYGIAKGFDISHVDLVAVLNADNWTGQADFQFDEKFIGNLFQLSGRANRPRSSGKGISLIQTFRPENPLLEKLKNWKWKSFISQELKQRKVLKYPPFGKLIKLTIKESEKRSIDRKSKTLYNKLVNLKLGKSTEISSPFYGFNQRIRGKWRKGILIKTGQKMNSKLKKFLQSTPENCSIDVDPENIF